MFPKVLDRVQSSFIDMLFLIVLMFAAAHILDGYENVPDWVRICIFVFIIIYEPLFVSLGCTLGNYIKGIRVRQHNNHEKKIGLGRSLLRFPVKSFLGIVSFFTIAGNPQRRAIHDIVSGSVVINKTH